MRHTVRIALAAIALSAAPAIAKPADNHNGSPPVEKPASEMMTDAQSRKMADCKAMSAANAAKDAACVDLMNRPDMTKEGGADNHNGTPHGAPPKPMP
jgi:hypothetical protein